MHFTLGISIFAHIVLICLVVFLPNGLFTKPSKIVAQNRVILDVDLVVDKGKVAKKQQLKTPKKVVNKKKTPKPQPKKVVKKPVPVKKTTAKKVDKKAPAKKQAVQKVAPKKSAKPTQKPTPQNTIKKPKKDVVNTKKLLKTTDKKIPQISDKNASKSTKLSKDAKPNKIINDVKQDGVKSKTNQNLVDNINPNVLMGQILAQLNNCWDVPAGVPNARNLIVDIHVKYAVDGSVVFAKVSNTSHSKSTTGMQQMIDAGLRAIYKEDCNPIRLDAKYHDKWKEVIIEFDPKTILQ